MSWKANRKLRGRKKPRALVLLEKVNYWLIARVAMLAFGILRLLPADTALNTADRVARRIGPLFGRNRTALDNLRRAYPDKPEAEIQAIASEMWGNMARLATEYIFLDRLFDYRADNLSAGRIEVENGPLFHQLADDGRPHILFTAHVGNFEMLSIAAATFGMNISALFRPPNNPYIADYILSKRSGSMGGLVASHSGAAFALAGTLDRGGIVAMLVDQKFIDGVPTTFFGRPCETNPVLPMLARRFDCDVYPVRCIRMPGNRYRLILEDRLDLARGAGGQIDIPAVAQQLNDVVERWVREHPGQWTWFHKRWALTKQSRQRRRWLRQDGTPVV